MMKDFEHDREPLRPAGDSVKVVAENGQTLIRANGEPNPFEKYKGALKRFRSRREINAWVSEMRDEKRHTD
jgi:hypothetical protein